MLPRDEAAWALECFLDAKDFLRPDNAVAALLILDDGRYVMQRRDALPNIFYPDHWGCFGGGVNAEEAPELAMVRELEEELEYTPPTMEEFTRFEFDFSKVGQSKVFRVYYEIEVSDAAFSQFVLHEGAAFEAVYGKELLSNRKVTPYDAFAVWMHMSRRRFQHA